MDTTSIPVPNHKLGQVMRHMVEQGKNPCFRIEGIRITIASEASINPGALYIKTNDWDYIGKITIKGLMKIANPSKISAAQKVLVLEAIYDPEKTAMSNGKVTGTCCCCGRTLTNPLSIDLGIGPICRELWFPPEDVVIETVEAIEAIETIETTTVREMINTMEATDSLELGLGAPYEPKSFVPSPAQVCFKHPNLADASCPDCLQDSINLLANSKVPESEPVMELFDSYLTLNSTQQAILANMIKTDYWSKNPNG